VPETRLIALLFASVFLGVHLVTLSICLWAPLGHKSTRNTSVNYLLVIVAVCMGIVGILDVLAAAVTAGNFNLFSDVSSWHNQVKDVNQCVQLLIGDAVITYRCWIVYERKWQPVIVSIVIWTATLVTSIVFIERSALLTTSAGVNAPAHDIPIIVIRIWNASQNVRAWVQGRNRLAYVARISLESGLVYTTTAIVTLAM
ncbi:hypothetical protein OBBRIDRAFT_732881, partial [Obba rivulosa]